jgi:hypothetical protein
MSRSSRWLTVLAAMTGVLAAIASAAGVLLRGDLSTRPFTTARGDLVDVLLGGIYRFNGKAIAAEGVGWDAVTLVLVVPALMLVLPAMARGSVRARLATIGVFGYLLYQYAEYAMALAYGPLFLLYVATFALSLTGIGLTAATIDVPSLPARVRSGFPHRGVVGFGSFMAVLLAGMWLPLVARTATAESVPELAGGTTLVVQAFDLGFLVPLGLFTAALVHRRHAVGYVLASVVVVKGIAMGCAIAAMLLVEGMATGSFQLLPIFGFAGIAAAAGWLAARVFRSIDDSNAIPAAPDQPGRSGKAVSLTTAPERS